MDASASHRVENHSGVQARPMRAAYRAPDVHFGALCDRALELAREGRVEDGLRMALVCIQEEPLHHGGYLSAAIIQESRGRYHEAELLCRRALVVHPDLTEAFELLAHVRDRLSSRYRRAAD